MGRQLLAGRMGNGKDVGLGIGAGEADGPYARYTDRTMSWCL